MPDSPAPGSPTSDRPASDRPASDEPAPETRPAGGPQRPARRRPSRHAVLLRLDPAVHEALSRWAADELRSVNAQVELVLRRALTEAGRLPTDAGPLPRRGRPPRS